MITHPTVSISPNVTVAVVPTPVPIPVPTSPYDKNVWHKAFLVVLWQSFGPWLGRCPENYLSNVLPPVQGSETNPHRPKPYFWGSRHG